MKNICKKNITRCSLTVVETSFVQIECVSLVRMGSKIREIGMGRGGGGKMSEKGERKKKDGK